MSRHPACRSSRAQSPTGPLGLPGQLFQAIAGTSMSSPHVAGLGALLRQAHPNWTPEQIKSALVVTGKTPSRRKTATTPADPFDMGGGRVNPNSAVNAGLTFKADFFDYLEFLCGNGNGCFGGVSAVDPSDLNEPSIGIAALAGSQAVVTDRHQRRRLVDDMDLERRRADRDLRDASFPPASPSRQAPARLGMRDLPGRPPRSTRGRSARSSGRPATVARSGCRSRYGQSVLGAPITFTATASADSGTLNWDIQAGYNGLRSTRSGFGLVADAPTPGLNVAQDPDQDIATGTFTDGVYIKDFSLAAGKLYTAALFNSTTEAGADLDMYLFADLNGNGTFAYPGELVRVSGAGDSNETIEFQRPPALNYRLVVHGWGTAGGDGSAFTLHEWYLPDRRARSPDPCRPAGNRRSHRGHHRRDRPDHGDLRRDHGTRHPVPRHGRVLRTSACSKDPDRDDRRHPEQVGGNHRPTRGPPAPPTGLAMSATRRPHPPERHRLNVPPDPR